MQVKSNNPFASPKQLFCMPLSSFLLVMSFSLILHFHHTILFSFFFSSNACFQLFLDTHEHDDSNNKKVDEEDFFADCENDLNGFSQNNNIVAANESKVTYMHACSLFRMFPSHFFFYFSITCERN